MLPTPLRQTLEAEGYAPVRSTHLAHGNNAQLYQLLLADGTQLVVKHQTGGTPSMAIEGWMLHYLSEHSAFPVPTIHASGADWLLMDYIESAPMLSQAAQLEAADHLAALHQIHHEQYGLERDTLIGPLHQPNTQHADWCRFFAEQRLIYMAKAAFDAGLLDAQLLADIEKLAARLPEWIDTPAQPSLIHGDMWGGNVLAHGASIAGFIDPAIYYADPEVELAFSTMFHTFGSQFFGRYNEHIPLRDGFWDVRKNLYNLYPLLVHVRVYGSSYVPQVKQITQRLLG